MIKEAASEGGTQYTRVAIDDDGNVGIGTGGPTSLLHVEGATPTVNINGTSSTGPVVQLSGTYTNWTIENQYTGGANNDMFRIRNSALSADALVINRGNNKVGIGNTNPTKTLDISGGIRWTSNSTADGNITFSDDVFAQFGDSNDLKIYHGSNHNRFVAQNGDIRFSTNNTERLRIEDTTGLVRVFGDLQVDGTTTTVNSTTVTVDDPVLTLGGDTAPSSDDNKDRGIEFRYYDGSAKVGFMGWDDSAGGFTFLKSATNSSEVFSGTAASLTTGAISAGGNLTMGGNQITGVSVIGGSGSNLQINAANGEHFLYGSQDGQVVLYHNGVSKFQTGSVGVIVAGRTSIEQSQDDNGLQINGFDDKSGETLKAYVRSTGNSRIDATRALNLFSGDSYGGGIGSGTASGVTWDAFNQFTFTAESNARIPLSIEGAPSQTGDLLNITSNGGSAGDLFTVESSGKVGIGTTTVAYPLHINGATTATLAIQCNGNNAEGSKIRLIEGSINYQGAFIHYDGSANALNIGVHTTNNTTLSDDTNVITIPRDTGDVGIGGLQLQRRRSTS